MQSGTKFVWTDPLRRNFLQRIPLDFLEKWSEIRLFFQREQITEICHRLCAVNCLHISCGVVTRDRPWEEWWCFFDLHCSRWEFSVKIVARFFYSCKENRRKILELFIKIDTGYFFLWRTMEVSESHARSTSCKLETNTTRPIGLKHWECDENWTLFCFIRAFSA